VGKGAYYVLTKEGGCLLSIHSKRPCLSELVWDDLSHAKALFLQFKHARRLGTTLVVGTCT